MLHQLSQREGLRRQLISHLKQSLCRWRDRGQSCQRSPKGSHGYLGAELSLTPELPVFFHSSPVSGLVTVFFQFPEGQTFTNKSKRLVYLAAYSIFPCPKTSQTWHIQKWIRWLPFSPLALLPGSPISVNGNPIVQLLRPKMMEPSSTSLFLSHATSNPSANPTGSSSKHIQNSSTSHSSAFYFGSKLSTLLAWNIAVVS